MRQPRINLTSFLNSLEPEKAKLLIIAIARGVVAGIKEGSLSITDGECLIFNIDILTYCQRIKDSRLGNLIAYGMELRDIEDLVNTSGALTRACAEMDAKLRTMTPD